MNKRTKLLLLISAFVFFLMGCSSSSNSGNKGNTNGYDFTTDNSGKVTLTIASGSENKEIEGIINEYAKANNVTINMDYMGSLEIMNLLQSGATGYDAVWPASSIWITLGDEANKLKHVEPTSFSPVIFGIRHSKAEALGFVGKDVSIQDIINAINEGKLRFGMTSATQSNSGASAYLAFLSAIAGSPEVLTDEHLTDPKVDEEIKALLAGVDRSSGSSDWLKDLYLTGDYDAMVNYESLVISANESLVSQNQEPMYAVYPTNSIAISDSPLAYIDNGDKEKEEGFVAFQKALLTDEAQMKMQEHGRRTFMGQVAPSFSNVFKKEWGINTDKVIAPITMPKPSVIMNALNLYQTEFKKPALTVYVLDYSGSMDGDGYNQMIASLEQVMLPENAEKHFLKGTTDDLTISIPFSSEVHQPIVAHSNGTELTTMYDQLRAMRPGGGTSMYEAVAQALVEVDNIKNLNDYNLSVIILSDGAANGVMEYNEFEEIYNTYNKDIPIFSIMFGGAEERELDQLAKLSNARVFDGRDDLVSAFKSVRGYN